MKDTKMKKTFVFILLLMITALIIISYTNIIISYTNAKNSQTIPYTVAQQYFVNNNVEDGIITVKITDKESFDEFFGFAAVMGNSTSTFVDFSKQYVIAVIYKVSDYSVDIKPLSLKKTGDGIVLEYLVNKGEEKLSYLSRVPLILIVDNQYFGKVKFVEKEQ